MIRSHNFLDSPVLPKRLRFDATATDSPDSAFADDFSFSAFPNLDQSPSTSSAGRAESINFSDPLYGLDENVKKFLCEQRGIKKLYDWQEQCLLQQMRNPNRNLIVSLPTSGGKTLLAEILILKALCRGKDALFILPFVSIVQEKIKALQSLDLKSDFLVEEYAGARGRIPPIKRRLNRNSVYVATIEKSQSLINSLIKMKRVDNLGIVIIDELHMLGEGRNRGAKLEQIIMTLKVATKDIQIVGLSATLSNMDEMKSFLDADVFLSDFRPVPLTESVKLGNTLFKVQPSTGSSFNDILILDRKMTKPVANHVDPDGITDLIVEIIPASSCLVFCPTKKNTENVASILTKTLPSTLLQHRKEEKSILLQQLQSEMGGDGGTRLCPILKRGIEFGVAYHHSGLTTDERNLLQDAFLNGTLCVICCTSTLAAGVNLPARRVILRSPLIAKDFLSKQQYRQMIGRAGRAGLDTHGESYLIINGKQVKKALTILQQGCVEQCESSLISRKNENGTREYDLDFGRYLLNVIGLEIINRKSQLPDFVAQTLAYIQTDRADRDEIMQYVYSILKNLVKSKLIKSESQTDPNDEILSTTKLGCAVMESGLSTETALHVYEHLRISVQCLVLSSHLHLLYCIVPFDDQDDVRVDWDVLYEEFCSLQEPERKVFSILSITEAYLLKKKMGRTAENEKDPIAKRLYSALILRRLWNQENIWSVSERFRVFRGVVQTLSQSCASSAGSILRFVEHLDDLWALRQLLPEFTKRLSNCVKPELLPLMEIQGVRRARAAQLFQSGYKTVASVANSDPVALMKSIEHLSRRQCGQIITSAKMLLREKMEILVEQAEETGLSVPDLITSLSQSFTI